MTKTTKGSSLEKAVQILKQNLQKNQSIVFAKINIKKTNLKEVLELLQNTLKEQKIVNLNIEKLTKFLIYGQVREYESQINSNSKVQQQKFNKNNCCLKILSSFLQQYKNFVTLQNRLSQQLGQRKQKNQQQQITLSQRCIISFDQIIHNHQKKLNFFSEEKDVLIATQQEILKGKWNKQIELFNKKCVNWKYIQNLLVPLIQDSKVVSQMLITLKSITNNKPTDNNQSMSKQCLTLVNFINEQLKKTKIQLGKKNYQCKQQGNQTKVIKEQSNEDLQKQNQINLKLQQSVKTTHQKEMEIDELQKQLKKYQQIKELVQKNLDQCRQQKDFYEKWISKISNLFNNQIWEQCKYNEKKANNLTNIENKIVLLLKDKVELAKQKQQGYKKKDEIAIVNKNQQKKIDENKLKMQQVIKLSEELQEYKNKCQKLQKVKIQSTTKMKEMESELNQKKQQIEKMQQQKEKMQQQKEKMQKQKEKMLMDEKQLRNKLKKENQSLKENLVTQKQLKKLTSQLQEKLRKSQSLLQFSTIFRGEVIQDDEDRKFIIVKVQELYENKKIVKTKLLYSLQLMKIQNPHIFIDNVSNYIVIMTLKNCDAQGKPYMLAMYSQRPLKQKQDTINNGKGFVASVNNKKAYYLVKNDKTARLTEYNLYYIVFGKDEIMFLIGKNVLELNIGHNFKSIDTGTAKDASGLTGETSQKSTILNYEVYQIYF